MTYLVFANACAVQVDDTKTIALIAYLKDEFVFHCFEQPNELPIVGIVQIKDSVACPDSAVLLHDKRLYTDGDVLYCKDGDSVVRIHLTKEQFTLEVDKNTNGGLLVLVMQTLLNWYMAPYGVTFLHTAAFKYDGKVFAIHGFGGAGKTEVMIDALERGAQYISDDLAIFDAEGRIYPYLRKISLHDYHFTEYQLDCFHLDKSRYHLMCRCQNRKGRISQYLYQRYRGRFNISVHHTAISPAINIIPVNDGLYVDLNYWLDASSATTFQSIKKDLFVKKITFCMANEFRAYLDFDGYLGIVYDFWQEKKESYNQLLSSILEKIDIKGLSIKTGHYADCANLILI